MEWVRLGLDGDCDGDGIGWMLTFILTVGRRLRLRTAITDLDGCFVEAWRVGVLFYLGNGVAFDGVWYEPISSDVPVPPLPIVEPFATTRVP